MNAEEMTPQQLRELAKEKEQQELEKQFPFASENGQRFTTKEKLDRYEEHRQKQQQIDQRLKEIVTNHLSLDSLSLEQIDLLCWVLPSATDACILTYSGSIKIETEWDATLAKEKYGSHFYGYFTPKIGNTYYMFDDTSTESDYSGSTPYVFSHQEILELLKTITKEIDTITSKLTGDQP